MEGNEDNENVLVPDISVLIDEYLVNSLKDFQGSIVVPRIIVDQLEFLATQGRSSGFIGLEELKKLLELSKEKGFSVEYHGSKAKIIDLVHENKTVILGQVRDTAWELGATLLTSDGIQARTAQALGIKVELVKSNASEDKGLMIDKYFIEGAMSVHVKQDNKVFVKVGKPGEVTFKPINEEIISKDVIKEMANEIIEKSNTFDDAFVEIERAGSSIVQYFDKRIVITRPPFSDGWEITAVKPLVKLNLDDYHLDPQLMERIGKKAGGILIAGSPGEGKSTFARALANFFKNQMKVVKTVESPRDLDLGVDITQYSKNFGDSEEVHDVLLLSRPDYTIFDEVRDTKDFQLYTDLRLSGIGMVGVLHSATPIDAIQRFIGRLELGMIASVLDTVIFIEKGAVSAVLGLKMTVKVPSGMVDSDLSRPVIEVKDVKTGEVIYELYSYGEETVVIPVSETTQPRSATHGYAQKELEKVVNKNYFKDSRSKARVEVVDGNKIKLYVSDSDRPRIIGKGGKNISQMEKDLGVRIDVLDLSDKKDLNSISNSSFKVINSDNVDNDTYDKHPKGDLISFNFKEDKKNVVFKFEKKYKGRLMSFFSGDKFLFDTVLNKKGEVFVSKKTDLGRELLLQAYNDNLKSFLGS